MVQLLDPTKIVSIVDKYATFKVHPLVYYARRYSNGNSEILSAPSRGIKVTAYVIHVNNFILILQEVPNGLLVDAYTTGSEGLKPTDPSEAIDVLADFINGRERLRLTPHEREGVAKLFMIPEKIVKSVEESYRLREILEDRMVAIIADEVYVLSKQKILIKLEGKEAVNLAKEVAFVSSQPIHELATHLNKSLGSSYTIYAFPRLSVACNRYTCHVLPLSRRVIRLMKKKLRGTVVELPNNTRYETDMFILPNMVTAIAFTPRNVFLLSSDGDGYKIFRKFSIITGCKNPIIYDRKGFVGYGKLIMSDGKVSVRIVEAAPKRSGGEWNYEQVISGLI